MILKIKQDVALGANGGWAPVVIEKTDEPQLICPDYDLAMQGVTILNAPAFTNSPVLLINHNHTQHILRRGDIIGETYETPNTEGQDLHDLRVRDGSEHAGGGDNKDATSGKLQ